MDRQTTISRRGLLKTTGGLAAMATLGSMGVNTAAASAHGSYVRVNQVGYLPDAEKVAVVVADEVSGTSFEVVDENSREVVTSGDLSDPVDDPIAGHTVRYAEFSALTDPGTYRVDVGRESSFPFDIGADVYDDVLRTTGRLYTLKRSGIRINDPETGMRFGPGHAQDENATVMTGDSEYDKGETVDVAGGWYDAGDYGKYTAPSAISVGAKLAAYERNPDAFSEGQYDFPSGVSEGDRGTMPDELVELKWKLEWLEKVQRRDGATWFIVSGTSWPEMTTSPSADTQQRYVFGLSSAATAMACANFAQAARIFEEHDPAFADRMLSNAEDAFAWLEDNPNMVWRMDPGQDEGSGPYHRGPQFEDPSRFRESDMADDDIDGTKLERFDRFWAAAELLKTTGDDRYHQHLEANHSDLFTQKPIDFDWYNGLAIGMYAYYTADAGDPSRQDDVASAMTSWADERLAHVADDGYNNALEDRDYHWASAQKGASYGVMFMLANEMAPDEDYVAAALDQLHHVLGRSATGYSYMTKTGSHSAASPHDRLVNSTGTLLPGMVVGGPNDDSMWPKEGITPSQVPYDDPGRAQLYVDKSEFYQCNEWAINYTAPVHWLLAEAVTLDSSDVRPPETPEPPETTEPPESPPELADGTQPQDPDTDGIYEDLNGNGRTDSDDVVQFFKNHDDPEMADNPRYYDINGNGRVDFDDIVSLFKSL